MLQMEKITGRLVSLEEHKENGLIFRRITGKATRLVWKDPQTTKRKLFNSTVICSLARDGLTQACLRKLMQLFDCEEKAVCVTRYPAYDYMYPSNCFTYCSHKMLIFQNRRAPYLVTEIKCKTTWLPAGNKKWFRSHVTRSIRDDISETNADEREHYSDLVATNDLPADVTVRRQLQVNPNICLIVK